MSAAMAIPLPGPAFRSAGRTDAGALRALNEDRFLDSPEARLWAVADGMGGHRDGGAASTLVIEALAQLGPFASGYAFLNGVSDTIKDCNEALVTAATRYPEGGVTGATIVALIIEEQHAACVWAGDSRAYHLSGGELKRLTRDHSLVQELLDAGALSPDEAAVDRRGHVITRAVGAAEDLNLDRAFVAAQPGDRFLLCSDGLTGVVSDEELGQWMAEADVDAAADGLMALALSRQPTDNVTLVVVEAPFS